MGIVIEEMALSTIAILHSTLVFHHSSYFAFKVAIFYLEKLGRFMLSKIQ